MKWFLAGVFIFFFAVVPMYALNSLIVPGLQNLKQLYANAGATAEAAVQPQQPTVNR